MKNGGTGVLALAASAALALAGSVQADALGKAEFEASCAACHGVSGTGDGPLAELMTVAIPDLTGIAARNDGVFPTLDVIQTVDGRSGVRGHGYPMPVWGARYKADLVDQMGEYGAEIEVRGRILSLVYYLESIQQ